MNQERQVEKAEMVRLHREMRLACDMSESVERLRQLGYSDRAILVAFETVRPRGNALEPGAIHTPPLIRRSPAKLRRIDCSKLELYTLENFLSEGECERVVALIGHHLHPSRLTYFPTDKGFRTSQTADLCHLRSPVATSLDAKICETMGIRAEYSEGIQAQRYDVGQQFKPHWDYFPPGTNHYNRLAGVRGNRTWTFMVYLNEGMLGGGTRFTELGLVRFSRSWAWRCCGTISTPTAHRIRLTMHCGEPVISGHKVIITKWFRVNGDGPVFYE